MLWRVRNSRGKPKNAPAVLIQPCRPTVSQHPPRGSGWAHELKHDGYRAQIHVRDGRVRLYTMNGADWSGRYPLIVKEAARPQSSTPRWCGLMPMALHNSTPCTAGSWITQRSPVPSICLCLMATICAANRLPSARRRCANCSSAPRAAFNNSSMSRAMVLKCSRPSASLALRASCQNGSTRHIALVHRKAGSRSRTRRQRLPRVLSRAVSDIRTHVN